MLSILLVVAAAAIFFGVDAAKVLAVWALAKSYIDAKKVAAVGLILLALLLMPTPSVPTPDDPPAALVLSGLFVGPSASEDASLIGALCNELADEIEYDGTRPEADRYLRSGVAVDELRKAARILRCRGVSIGDRQPRARDTIAVYLDSKVGTDGGSLSSEQRAAWVNAYRDIGRAATDAAK